MIISGIVFLLLGLAAVVLLCLADFWFDRKQPQTDFDERQMHIQAKARGLCDTVGVVYYIIIALFLGLRADADKIIEPWLLVVGGLYLITAVYMTYCILQDADLPLSRNFKSAVASFGTLGIFMLLQFRLSLRNYGPLALVGKGAYGWVSLVCGILCLWQILLMFIRNFIREKE